MQLDKEAIEEFKKLYLKEYGIKLTDSQVMECGTRLIKLVKAVYGNGDNLLLAEFDMKSKKTNN